MVASTTTADHEVDFVMSAGTLFSGHRGFQTQGPVMNAIFVAQGRQMLHRLADSVEIIDSDVADPGTRWPNIDKDQGHFSQLQVFKQHLFHTEG
jgi:hypothetical protein